MGEGMGEGEGEGEGMGEGEGEGEGMGEGMSMVEAEGGRVWCWREDKSGGRTNREGGQIGREDKSLVPLLSPM